MIGTRGRLRLPREIRCEHEGEERRERKIPLCEIEQRSSIENGRKETETLASGGDLPLVRSFGAQDPSRYLRSNPN